MKQCEFCRENVHEEAKQCRYCCSLLAKDATDSDQVKVASEKATETLDRAIAFDAEIVENDAKASAWVAGLASAGLVCLYGTSTRSSDSLGSVIRRL